MIGLENAKYLHGFVEKFSMSRKAAVRSLFLLEPFNRMLKLFWVHVNERTCLCEGSQNKRGQPNKKSKPFPLI